MPRKKDQSLVRGVVPTAESTIQTAVADTLRQLARKGVVWTHVPNGGLRNKAVAAQLKQHGVRAGWPDILLVADGQAYAMELKTRTGRLSLEQQDCLKDLGEAGAKIAVCWGVDDAVVQLQQWGLLRPAAAAHPAIKAAVRAGFKQAWTARGGEA